MSAKVHPTYEDTSQAMSRAAQKAIMKPVMAADATPASDQMVSARALQDKLKSEFSGPESSDYTIPSTERDMAQQVMMIAVIAGATWVLGFALYANL